MKRRNDKRHLNFKKPTHKLSGNMDVLNGEYVGIESPVLNAGGPALPIATKMGTAPAMPASSAVTPAGIQRQNAALAPAAAATPAAAPAVTPSSAPALPTQAQVDQMDCTQLQSVWTTTQNDAADYQSPQSLYIQWQQISSYIHTKLVACQSAPVAQAKPVAVIAPVANPVWPNNLVTLDGSGSSQPGGGDLTYEWSFISASGGGQYLIQSPDTAETQIVGLTNGSKYTFQLTVKNASLQSATAQVSFTVVDSGGTPAGTAALLAAPVAVAGDDQTISLPTNEVMLDGSESYDPQGSPLASYSWSMVSGPSAPSIVGQNQAKVTITNLVQGVYVFQLTVTSSASQKSASANVSVTVNAPDTSTNPVDTSTDSTAPVSATVPALIVPLSPYGTTYPSGAGSVGGGGGDGGGDDSTDTSDTDVSALIPDKRWLWLIPVVIIVGFILFDHDKKSDNV